MNQTTQKLNISLTYNFKNRIAWMNYIEITKIKKFCKWQNRNFGSELDLFDQSELKIYKT